MRISAAQRTENENRIRAAMDRLLRGEIPPGGKRDIKTLAIEAAVERTAFYGTRPYAHLRVEFERRLNAPTSAARPWPGSPPSTKRSSSSAKPPPEQAASATSPHREPPSSGLAVDAAPTVCWPSHGEEAHLASDQIGPSSAGEGITRGRRTMSEPSKAATMAKGNRSTSRQSATSSGWTP